MDALKYFDISPVISSRTAVYPGDIPFSRNVALDMNRGDHLTLSSIEMTLHIGAHTDAPNHYHKGGAAIAERSLDYYLGLCQVMRVKVSRGSRIYPGDLKIPIKAERILFHTGSFPDGENWNSDYNSLSPELINDLHSRGVKLIGIDTPSVDPDDSKALESHNQIFAHDMAILEGIVLNEVPDGLYTLIALPLKIEGADASPVRAILLPHQAGS